MAKHLPLRVKYKLLRKVLKDNCSVASVCRRAGISRTIFYRWKKEFEQKPENLLGKGRRFFRQTPPEKEKLVLDLILRHPEYSSHRISQVLGINHKGKLVLGNHGVQNVLRRLGLSRYPDRLAFQKARQEVRKKPLWLERKTLLPSQRLAMIERVIKNKEKVAIVCREFGISRVIFYRWLARYRQAPKGLESQTLDNKERKIERYWRQVEPHWEKTILDLVLVHPEWSVPKIVLRLGKPAPGYYGVQRVLERNNLNTYQRRLTYRESLRPTPVAVPAVVPEVVGPAKRLRFLKAPFAAVPKLVRSPRSLLLTLFLTFVTLFILKRWIGMLASAPAGTQVGLVFATVSLTFGAFFFIYSLKYYFTLILILGFSRQVSGGGENGQWKMGNGKDGNGNGKGGILGRLFGSYANGENGNGNGNGNGKGSIWERIFGVKINGNARLAEDGESRRGNGHRPGGLSGGLQPDLSVVELERKPFVSIHLPMYNEKRVVDRLLAACTTMEYENYEVIVADDSTDDTKDILVKNWQGHPRVKILHRDTREGFKGAALQGALRQTDPRAEFILVFDADFLPYPDTITQFLKYFQATAGGLDFGKDTKILRYKDIKSKKEENHLISQSPNISISNIAAVQGYQWHILNKSENWITRGVRSEYAGSYVIERSGEEALGALKQIAGSVYMIRRDILEKYGWGTSITEDFELTLRLYRDGYKVVYTPYIQTPSECVSTLKRLIRQRMRWAEGHSYNIKKMFTQLMWGRWEEDSAKCKVQSAKLELKTQNLDSGHPAGGVAPAAHLRGGEGKVWVPSKLTLIEKMEFLYLSPYYLQATFFIAGTLSWFIAEAIFQVRLPFWTALWGWSLVFTNMFSLPLMNVVGLFLEESEERDYGGILSFTLLTYLVVPFQAYAAVKGFLEKQEGPWFRTPKTGKITDMFTPGRFARFVSMIFPGRRVAPTVPLLGRLGVLGGLGALGAKPAYLRVSRKRVRGLANLVIVVLVLISIGLTYVSLPLTPTLAYTGTFYFRNSDVSGGAEEMADTSSSPRKMMSKGTVGTSTQSVTFGQAAGTATTYYAHNTAASITNPSTLYNLSTSPYATSTRYGSGRQLFRDGYGNLIAVVIDSAQDIKAYYLNAADQIWNGGDGAWDLYGTDIVDTVTANNVSGALDSSCASGTSCSLHISYEDVGTTSQGRIQYKKIDISRNASGVIQTTGWTLNTAVSLDTGTTNDFREQPSLIIDKNNFPAVCWGRRTALSGTSRDSQQRFSRCNAAGCAAGSWTCETGSSCSTFTEAGDIVYDPGAVNTSFHCAMGRMPDAPGTNTNDDALYIFYIQDSVDDLFISYATINGTNYNAWAAVTNWTESAAGSNTGDAPYDLTVAASPYPNQDALAGILFAYSDAGASNNTSLYILRNKDAGATPTNLSPSPAASFTMGGLSLMASSAAQPNIYLFGKGANGATANDIVYRKRDNNATSPYWDGSNTTFDNSAGNTDNYPQIKETNACSGACSSDGTPANNNLNDGGRVDVIFYDGTNIAYNYLPLAFKTLDTTAPTAGGAKEITVGTKGIAAAGVEGMNTSWDDLHFVTSTFSSDTNVGSTNWTVRSCYGAGAASDVVRARWEVVANGGVTDCSSGGECGSWATLTKAGAPAECVQNTAVSPPSTITNLNGYRLKLRVNYSNDGSAVGPVRFDDTSGNNGDTLVTAYFGDPVNTFYILTDNMNKKWTATTGGDKELPTEGTTSEQRNPSIATNTSGNTFSVWEDERNSQGLGTWATTGAMAYARANHTATLLNSGKVLVVGECEITFCSFNSNSGLTIAELYDPSTLTFSTIAPSTFSREVHTATLLNNGKVLVVGTWAGNAGRSIAELYDPSTQAFSTTGSSTFGRGEHTATLLNNGKVLVTGTVVDNGGRTIPELYDPSTQAFSTTGTSTYARDDHTTTLLNNGKVLVVGTGFTNGGRSIPELYDPSTQAFSTTGTMTYGRYFQTATLLNNGKVLVVGNGKLLMGGGSLNNGGLSIAELYDPVVNTFSTTGAMTYARELHTATILNNGKVLVVGTSKTNGGQSIAEIYDPSTGVFSTTAPSTYVRSQFTATLLNNGKILAVGTSQSNGGQSIAELYTPKTADIYAQKFNEDGTKQWANDVRVNSDDGNRSTAANNPSNYDHLNPKVKLDSSGNPIIVWQEARNSVFGDDIWAQKLDTNGAKQWPAATTGTWATTGTVTYARKSHTATLLSNGKTLLTGTGWGGSGQSIPELYDPSTQAFSTTAGTMTYSRDSHTATLLNNGKVLVAGTSQTNGGLTIPELYDPSTQAFSTTGPSNYSRFNHTATLLSSGKVLLAGTGLLGNGESIAELFDPTTNTFSTVGNMPNARSSHTATLLSNGKVLVAGGIQGGDTWFSQAELFDPQTSTFSTTGTMTYARSSHTATLLQNGKVLVAGGCNTGVCSNSFLSQAELYDPSTNTFTTVGNMTYIRDYHVATLLNNGKVLAVGTSQSNGGRSIAELYDPATNTWTTTGAMTYGRDRFTSTLLNNGKILAVGTSQSNGGQTIAELYTPQTDIQVSNDGSPTNGYGLPRPEQPNNGKGILGEQRNPVLAIDSSNNAVVAWEDTRFAAMQNWGLSFNNDANAWRQTNINLAAAGACNGGGGAQNSCGAIPLIQNNPLRIMGQMLNSSGVKQWGDDVDGINGDNPWDIGLASTGDFSANPAIAADGTNFVISWESNGGKPPNADSKNYDIYGQKFDTNGASGWGGTWATTGTATYARNYHSATLLSNGKTLVTGTGFTNGGLTIAELYDPSTQAFSTTGRSTYSRSYHTTTLLNSGKILVVGTTALVNGGQSIAELYDPSTQAFSTTGRSTYSRSDHTATLLNSGKVLVAGTSWANGGQSIAELYDPSTQAFSTTAPATYARYYHTATLLNNGKVLVAGTGFTNGGQSIAELYDPSTQAFSTTGAMIYARNSHTATLLNSGKVLVAGTSWANAGQSIAELYDPSTQAFSTTAPATYARAAHTATLLNNGKVLVTGTGASNGGQSIAELYSIDQMISSGKDLADQRYPDVAVDSGSNYIFAWQGRRGSGTGGGPSNGDSDRGGGSWKIYGQKTDSTSGALWPNGTAQSWATTGTATYARYAHTATLLNNGKVLVAGTGFTNGGRSIAEIYDPATNTFTTTGPSTYARFQYAATLLSNGKTLVTGTGKSNDGQSIAEIYDPATQTFTTIGPSTYGRYNHTATLLANGKVFLTGTQSGNGGRSIAEIYDPATNTFTTTGPAIYLRYNHTATLLNNGKVLVAGGVNSGGGLSIAEIYDPSTQAFSTTGTSTYGRDSPTATLLNNGKVLVTGTGAINGGQSIAELYDPSTQAFSTTGTSTYARASHTATLLASGKVLLTGTGWVNGGQTIPELYDPSTQAWSTTGPSTYGRSSHTATLLNNGKVLVVGTQQDNDGQSIAELYTPEKSEMMFSHDFGMKGDQVYPKLAVSGTNTYAVWQDNRSAISNTVTADSNIFIQQFDANGLPLWPASTYQAGYGTPYAVMDVRADTYAGNWGSHYSGKPAIGGIFNHSDGAKPLTLVWEDNRTPGDPMEVFAQAYDTTEQDISKSTSWTVYFDVNQVATLAVKVGIMEWDGTTPVLEAASQTWNSCSPSCPSEQSLAWTTGGSPAPPSDTIGNVSMRRLIVEFTRTSGSATIYFDNSGSSYDSRLSTGDVVPEKVLYLGLIIPFLPPAIAWYNRRRKGAVRVVGVIREIGG